MTSLVALANPKGSKKTCELCSAPALIECSECKVTYWCSKEHETCDRQAIHKTLCPFMGALRRPASGFSSQKEREQHKEQQRERKMHLMKVALDEAECLYNQSRFDLAVPAALQALRFGQDVYGPDKIELVSAQILIGAASLGAGQLAQAETNLAQANWLILKNENCSNKIKSQLFRALGRLHFCKHNNPMALRQLAEDIYCASQEFGPDNIHVAGGYYFLGLVFEACHRSDIADAMHQKTVEVWKMFLQQAVEEGKQQATCLTTAQVAEAQQHLSETLRLWQATGGGETAAPKIADAYFANALLHHLLGQRAEAEKYYGLAIALGDKLHGSDSTFVTAVETCAARLAVA